MKVLFSGGGTLGPVTPLLAIEETIQAALPTTKRLWIGTRLGPERRLIEAQGIRYVAIASGKFRRYVSFWNVTDALRIFAGFFQSLWLVWKEKPALCISAGGFVSVPVHWAAWCLGVPSWVHAQDADVGLAVELMAPFASCITTALEENAKKFSSRKTFWLGNPVRRDILRGSKEAAVRRFGLDTALPTIFALGGGTGSARVNQLIAEALPHLSTFCNIIHLSGRERPRGQIEHGVALFDHYFSFQFFTEEMKDAYAAADIVVARAGFGTLTELAALQKAAVLIPKGGHQEANVAMLKKRRAAIGLNDRTANGYELGQIIRGLVADSGERQAMGKALSAILPSAQAKDIMEIFERLVRARRFP